MNPILNKAVLPIMQKMMSLQFTREKSTVGFSVERFTLESFDGNTIRAILYTPRDIKNDAACLIYYHGGGFVIPAAPYHYSLAKEYAQKTPCKVLFVDYRLAPKFPFPVAPEDCFATYKWALFHSGELGIDASRIAVAGDSAGGGLATVVCLMANDRGIKMPCAEMLIYPVTASGLETESTQKYTDTPMCNTRDMKKYGKYYVQDEKAGKRAYLSPIEAESLSEMPPTYIETAEFDCLRDYGIQYAEKLKQFGVTTELHNTEGTIHGFDIELNSSIVRACVEKRICFLQKYLMFASI